MSPIFLDYSLLCLFRRSLLLNSVQTNGLVYLSSLPWGFLISVFGALKFQMAAMPAWLLWVLGRS